MLKTFHTPLVFIQHDSQRQISSLQSLRVLYEKQSIITKNRSGGEQLAILC